MAYIAVQLKEGEASLLDILTLLLASVIFVPIFQRIPGGIPFLLIRDMSYMFCIIHPLISWNLSTCTGSLSVIACS
jgi:hypothetical protein